MDLDEFPFPGDETFGRPWDQVDQVDSDVSKWHCISWTLGPENAWKLDIYNNISFFGGFLLKKELGCDDDLIPPKIFTTEWGYSYGFGGIGDNVVIPRGVIYFSCL